jgi:hypothetical protein
MTGHDHYEANYVAFDEVSGWPTTASNSVGHITPCATEDLKIATTIIDDHIIAGGQP